MRIVSAWPVVLAAVVCLPGSLIGAASASVYLVTPDGSGDFPTIQAAVDSSSDGDEILLADGVFAGAGNVDINPGGRAITIRSASGNPADCIVDCEDDSTCVGHSGFVCSSGEDSGTVIEGITIRNARDGYCSGGGPGAIRCDGASPTFRKLEIRDSVRGVTVWNAGSPSLESLRIAGCDGPGVVILSASPTLSGCVIESNTLSGTAGGGAAGVTMSGCSAVFDSCRIEGNRSSNPSGAGGVSLAQSSPTFRDCVFANNAGSSVGAIWIGSGSFPSFQRCTVARNLGPAGGGGLGIAGGSTVTLDRTIVWGNCGAPFEEIEVHPGALLMASCSDLRLAQVGGGGTLNLGADVLDVPPMYCNPKPCSPSGATEGSYAVDADSPVLHAACGRIGALASECDVAVEPTSWGHIKALYR